MPKLKLRDTLAQNILRYRARERLSQDEFAHRSGLHRTYVGAVERRERNVTLSTLEMLAVAMCVDVPTLLTPGGIS
jgi:transcriptional regulator with XRE-family HTH domain